MKSILNLAWKEIIQLWRDRLLLVFLIGVPSLQLLLIAEATGAGVRGIKLAVWDQDRTTLSQRLVTTLDNTDEFVLTARASSYEQLSTLVTEGGAGVALIIPPDFTREASRPDGQVALSAIVDGTNVIVANNVLGAVEAAVGDLLVEFSAQSAGARPGGIDLKIQSAFNPTLNIRWATLTAQLPFILYQLVLVIAAVGFVRERELGTMEQLVVTPISRLDLLLGKGLMALVIGLVNLYVLFTVLTQGFHIPMRGDLLSFTLLGLVFILAEIGMGTLISLITASQQQSILIVFMLSILEVTFSGLLVPTENMPGFMQVLAAISPMQHFTAITRAMFIKGSTVLMLWPHVIPLLLFTGVALVLSWLLFMRSEI